MSYLINSMDTSYYERQFDAMGQPAQYPYISSGSDSSDQDSFIDLDAQEHQYREAHFELSVQMKQLKRGQRRLQKEEAKLNKRRLAFEREAEIQRMKWDSIAESLKAKAKNKTLNDDEADFSKKGKEEVSDDGLGKGRKSKGGGFYQADHEKCHRVHDKTKKRLRDKSKECEELQKQIGKLREELRESHQSDEKFLELGQTVITQKFELNQLRKQTQSLEAENKKLQSLYNNLAAHCHTTAYIDCEETHDADTTTCSHTQSHTTSCSSNSSSPQEPSRTVLTSSSSSSSSSNSTTSGGIRILAAERSPCGHVHCRPVPRITRFTRTTRAQREATPMTCSELTCTRLTSTCPPTLCTASNIDTKFREVHELSQQIEQLREQLLDVKRSASFTRSKRSSSYSSTSTRSRTASEKSYSSRRSASVPVFQSAIDRLIEECPEEEMHDLDSDKSSKSTPPFRGMITWDELEEEEMEKRLRPRRSKKKGPCNGLWRLFGGICGSRSNLRDD